MRIIAWSSDGCSSDLAPCSHNVRTDNIGKDKPVHGTRVSVRRKLSYSALFSGWIAQRSSSATMPAIDRKSVVEGKSVSVSVDLGGRRIMRKKTNRDTL